VTKHLAVILLIGATCGPCFAQNSEQYKTCADKANTQHALHVCANEEATRTDAELNKIYHQLLALAEGQPGAVAKVKNAERAWIAYRKAYLDAMYPGENKQAYGSIYPMEANLRYASLTRKQITALKELVEQYTSLNEQNNPGD
jgi:uncharacterized protein YecT (DUF1311 family)